MEADPLKKIREVAATRLTAISFSAIQFKESKTKEVQEKGGVMTRGNTIYFDPLYVSTVDDGTLAFVVAHEHGHWHLGPSGDDAQDENDADEYALRKLQESGWTLVEAERSVAGWKFHSEWYFETTKQSRPGDLDAWASLLTRSCAEIYSLLPLE